MCRNVRGKSRKLRSGFCEVGYCRKLLQGCRFALGDEWFLLRTMVDQGDSFSEFVVTHLSEACDIWIKVSFRGFARQFISSCLLIENSC